MNYFTLLRHSGFGDYFNTAQKLCFLLGAEYEFVVLDSYKYKNYHSPEVDFINLFYNGKYSNTNNIKKVSLKEALRNKPELDQVFIIELTNDNFDKLKDIRIDSNFKFDLFSYKPTSNPFLNKENNATLHIRASDILNKRKIIDPSKVKQFIEEFSDKELNLIVCSDLEKESDILYDSIQQLQFNKNVNLIKKIIGRNKEKTIESMDAIYHSDFVFSKSSSFISIFRKKVISIPDEYCF